MPEISEEVYECEECGYETESKRGIGVHRVRLHNLNLEDRFWRNVEKGGVNECWLWQGSVNCGGYGQIKHDGKMKEVHRFIFNEFINPPIDNYQVNHLCDNKHCLNPNHLYLGNYSTNALDQVINDERETKLDTCEYFQIKDLLANTKFTQQEIADFYGISQTMVYRINKGERGQAHEIKKRLEGTIHDQH